MPLTVGNTFTPLPPGEGVGSVLEAPLMRGFGSMWAVWTDPDGGQWQLSNTLMDHGYFTTREIGGIGAAPYELVTDPLSRGGEEVRFIRSNPRRITWPLHIWGDSHAQFLTRYRNLQRAFTLTSHRGAPGTLTLFRYDEDGVITEGRQIEAYYEEGFDIAGGQGQSFANPVLTLFCPDGYWRDITPVQLDLSYRQGAPFLVPYPTVSPSGISGQYALYNAGEVDAWPLWQIAGPMTSLTATNSSVSGGLAFTLGYPLQADETAVVDLTKPNRPMLYNASGDTLSSYLDWPGASLWPLASGENRIDVQMAGAGPTSHITLTFQPRYESA